MRSYKYIIGIDPGVTPGWALYDTQKEKLLECETLSGIGQLFARIILFTAVLGEDSEYDDYAFIVEDARKIYHPPDGKEGRKQGAFWIKTLCSEIGKYLEERNANYVMRPPSKMKKMNSKLFNIYTGWEKRTSSHARDAALMCWKVNRI